jgi:anti-anti-sigma factor
VFLGIREELKFEDRRGLQLSEPYGQSGLAKGSFTNPVPSLTNLNTGDGGSRLSCKKPLQANREFGTTRKANMLSSTIHELRETIVFQCTGRIVFGQCDILRDAFLFHPHSPIAVLDMAEVMAVDAAGLGLLVELRNWACARRTQLRLLNVTPYLEKLLQITNLVRILDVCSVREMMDLYRAMHVVTIATVLVSFFRAE